MKTTAEFDLPPDRQDDLRRAKRLAWWSIPYLLSAAVLIYLTMGSSQAMKTAWAEDLLSLIPPIGFLIATRVRNRSPNPRYPYGYFRAINIAFFAAALALLSMGGYLLYDALSKLIKAEHPTIGSFSLLGHTVWLGWPMLVTLAWSCIPAVFLGRAKLRAARELHDKPLFADAMMNKADWMTGAAAGLGIMGIGYGYWWADAAAAAIISVDILKDGVENVKAVVGDLMDREPESVDHKHVLDLPAKLRDSIQELPWVQAAEVRLREHGHVMFGEVYIVPRDDHSAVQRTKEVLARAHQLDWRLHDLCVQFVDHVEATEGAPSPSRRQQETVA